MNIDLVVLTLLAILDLAVIVYLRRRHAKKGQTDRMAASLRMALDRANGVTALPTRRPLRRAS